MPYCYEDIHLGHRPVVITMVSGCLAPLHFSIRRARYCTHPYHEEFVREEVYCPPHYRPRGVTLTLVNCGLRYTLLRLPFINAGSDDAARLIDAMLWVGEPYP